MDEPHLGRKQLISLAVLFEGGMIVLALLLGWLTDIPILGALDWNIEDVGLGIAACAPMLLLFAACLRWPVGSLRSIHAFTDEVIRPLFRSCSALDLAVICILAGFGEEALFRGLLQPLLERYCDPWLAVAIASLAFGIMHPISPTYAMLATGVGIYLGIIFRWNQNLVVVMLAHALYDFVALLYLTRR
jgi:membrane protease YdiL (CAAX protease family)